MEDQPMLLAQVPSAPGSKRLHFSWGLGNELFCSDISGNENEASTSSCVQWGVLTAPQRRIAYDTAGKFTELQQELHRIASQGKQSPQQQWAAVLAYSKAVSAILEVHDDSEDGTSPNNLIPEDVQAAQERALWDLVSLFSLDPQAATSTPLIPDLPRWLRSNAIALSGSPNAAPLPRSLAIAFQTSALPESHPKYWPTLQRLVALGWISDALEILGLHSAWLQWGSSGENPAIDAQVAVLEAATLLLRRMPSLKGRGPSASGGTTREFDSIEECLTYRTAWQQQCKALLQDNAVWEQCEAVAPETAESVKHIIQILAGDELAAASATQNWAELLVTRLQHVYPGLQTLAELRQLLHSCLEERAPPSEFHHVLAAVLETCCEGDPQTALRSCSAIASDWLMAHIPALLASHPAGASLLGRELPHLGATQVEFYMLEYANALAPHVSTWPLAASYLAWCESYGHSAFQALVERLPYDPASPKLALKASAAAKDQGLTSLATSVSQIQGSLCWQRGMIGAAVASLSTVRDIERIDVVLKPLASQVWGSKSKSSSGNANEDSSLVNMMDSSTAMETIAAMKESIESVPPGSAHHAMVQVKTLLNSNSSNENNMSTRSDINGAVQLLRELPREHLRKCLGAVLAAVPLADASKVSSESAMQLMQWLEAYGSKSGSEDSAQSHQAVARLALVRSLVAAHLVGTGNTK